MSDSTMQALQILSLIFVDTAEREAGSSWKEEYTTQVREPPSPETSPLLAMNSAHKGVEPHQLPPMAMQPEPRLLPPLTFTKTQTGKESSKVIKSETPSAPPTTAPPPRRAARKVAALRGNTIIGNNTNSQKKGHGVHHYQSSLYSWRPESEQNIGPWTI